MIIRIYSNKSHNHHNNAPRLWTLMVKVPILKVTLMVIMMIFIYKGIFLPKIVAILLRTFITTKQMLAAVMIIIYQRWILRKIYLKPSGEKKPMSHKMMMKKSVMKTLLNALHHWKAVDVDETLLVSIFVGKSISHKEKITLLDKQPCQPSKAVLSKRKKKVGKRAGSFNHKDGTKHLWLTHSLNNDALHSFHSMSALIWWSA